jgi:hypothetical protein
VAGTEYSWVTAAVEVHPKRPFIPTLTQQLARARDLYTQTEPDARRWRLARTTLKASIAGVGGEAEFSREAPAEAGQADLALVLREATEAALVRDAGLLLTVDELHLASKTDLATLAACLQLAVGEGWPLVTILAGLPNMQDPKRMVTYLERGEWHTLGLLSPMDALTALAEPALAAGRPMSKEAAHLLADASGGYPYAIQVVGHHTWRASHNRPNITAAHARAGIAAAHLDLAAGLYSSRWQDTAPREKDYLRALSHSLLSGQHPTGADVARELGETPASVSYLRDRLLRKGTIYTEGTALRLAVPGMAEWIMDPARS